MEGGESERREEGPNDELDVGELGWRMSRRGQSRARQFMTKADDETEQGKGLTVIQTGA